MQPDTENVTFCGVCGKHMKINSQGLPAYHAECAKEVGLDHGTTNKKAEKTSSSNEKSKRSNRS